MASLKTVGTIAVIVGCFAIIYPRFMHPMVLRMFGMQPDPRKQDDHMFPPNMRGAGPMNKEHKPPMHGDPRMDPRHHMRPGPHPGMRAAAEMQKQQSQGGGRGMMGIVLPMYAIGICVYLVYTLVKVFNKRGQYSTDPYSTKSRNDANNQQRMDGLGFPRDIRGRDGEVQRFLQQKTQEKELEDLLTRMDDTRNVSEEEMRALQKRLEDTEAQMTRILAAMQAMQTRVTPTAAAEGNAASAETAEDVETVGQAREGAGDAADDDKGKVDNASGDISPSTESFEIVKNREAASEATTPSETSSFCQLDGAKEEDGEEEEEEDGEKEEEDKGELIESKPQDDEESTVRHRKAGNVDED